MCFCEPHRDLVLELQERDLELWELPRPLRGLYFLGEHYGHLRGVESALERIEQLETECDRLFTQASQGSFKRQQAPQGLTYAELCRARGENALADAVEADWKQLLEDREVSRLDLLNERREASEQPGQKRRDNLADS